ncbi:MAG: DNA polymerase I [Candidatus Saccharimonadales bacterium]
MENSGKKRLVIIDGKSVFYRGYYAMPNLSLKDGTPSGGVYGFAVMALEVIKRLKPDYVCVAWDKPKTNIRKRLEMYSEYKAGRKPAPADFYEQVPILHELLNAFGWPLYELDDYEADDIMGTLAVKAKSAGLDTLLVTSDLDLLQVINDSVHVYALKKGLSNIELFHPDSFTEKYGIDVQQFLDLKSIKGDSSDNIPGVPGIGEKGAIDLLQKYKTLDGVYENLDEIRESVRNKLIVGKDSAYLSKKIAAIWTDAPIELDLESLDVANCNPQDVREVLQKLEFRTLLRQLPEAMQSHDEHMNHIESNLILPKHTLINSDNDLGLLDIEGASELIIHSYVAGKHGQNPRLIAISPSPKTVFTLNAQSISTTKLHDVLGDLISRESVLKIGYDIKSTIKVFLGLDFEFNGVGHDVLVGSFLLNSLRREQTLTELAMTDLGYEGSEFENLSPDEFGERVPEMIAVIRGLYEKQVTEMAELPKMTELAQSVEWPVIPVLANMEFEGIKLDTDYLNKMSEELDDQISDIQQQIYGYAEKEFNVSSPSQLAEVLFNDLGMPTTGVKKGKTGYSTAAKELDKLRGQHPIIDLITEYREYTKLKSTYVDTLPQMVDENSRLHTTFALTVAQTGRLSSNDPNLQNIPVRTELGKRIRTAFVAEAGKVFVSADYSQFELRLAAYFAKDEELIDMFNRDVDVHLATASQVYGRAPEDVTKNMRRDAKVINFGILYGMSPHGLSVATGMTMEQAKHFIDKYFELRKPILDYMEGLKYKAHKEGYVETLFGRRRPMPDINSSNFVVRQAAERAAINMPIQGTEADLMKMAMIEVDQKLDDDCRQLLQIHDSIMVECPRSKAKDVAKILKSTMENIYKLPVKLTVDTSEGENWGEL